jgi:hypothetical protein
MTSTVTSARLLLGWGACKNQLAALKVCPCFNVTPMHAEGISSAAASVTQTAG